MAKSCSFLTNHANVLLKVALSSNLSVRQIALSLGITERSVQGIMSDLEQEGYITRERIGRKNRYNVDSACTLPQQFSSQCTLGDFVDFIQNFVLEDRRLANWRIGEHGSEVSARGK
jgi:predicted transcriptional regulator